MRLLALICSLLLTSATPMAWCAPIKHTQEPVRVACIGNSITYGFLVPDREHNNYPRQLGDILGPSYRVENFGHSGATLLRRGHNPYDRLPEYAAALAFKPDIAIIHLGVNDTDPRDWPNYGDEFVGDYLALVDSLRAANPRVRILAANLSPLLPRHKRWRSGTMQWRDSVRHAIACAARAAGAELIDFATPLSDSPQLLPDGIHPNEIGARLMAEYAAGAITGHWGGLQMPVLYTDSMVLQRRKPLHIAGSADAHCPVKVTLGRQQSCTVADHLGRWHVQLPPMETATGLTLTIGTPDSTAVYRDVAIGEVWVASGQSNMAFTLREDADHKAAAARMDDKDLRLFDMKPRYVTDKHRWDSLALARVNRLQYYGPTHWQASRRETALPFSAIAWYFARQLRDSLDVPVGIICNAVGGAPAAAFVSQERLRHHMPEVLVNWRTNDYLQPWVQQRAGENAPDNDRHLQRHPYEPAYLHSAGIAPLGQPAAAGVLWYQGESDAHNTEVHEQLMPLVVDTWREELRDPSLPFYFVQLSGIDRPSWPRMRDSQRRLAAAIPGAYMTVSHDWGDSLDVHPRHKLPIARRMAAQALHNNYARNVPCHGPEVASATALPDGSVLLSCGHASALTPAGTGAIGFELAAIPGCWHPATATIDGNTIRLQAEGLTQPCLVRYAWQPFTRANVCNEAGLPMSTFCMAIDNPQPKQQ